MLKQCSRDEFSDRAGTNDDLVLPPTGKSNRFAPHVTSILEESIIILALFRPSVSSIINDNRGSSELFDGIEGGCSPRSPQD